MKKKAILELFNNIEGLRSFGKSLSTNITTYLRELIRAEQLDGQSTCLNELSRKFTMKCSSVILNAFRPETSIML